MKWTDSREIAIALAEAHPGIDPSRVLFVGFARLGTGVTGLRRRPQAKW
jgi:FeS assembly protein IscX